MVEGAISQAPHSRPRWWSEPFTRSLLTLRDGGRSSLPNALLQAALVERTLHTKIHTETCWRENAFTQTFSFTNVHRANFLPKPPGHAKSARPRGRLRPSNSPQWSFELFTSGISPSHCGQLSESRRSFQQNAPVFSAKRPCFFSETPWSFQQNTLVISAKRSSLFSETLWSFQRNALVISAKRSSLFSETPRPFQRNTSAFSAKHLSLFIKKRHRTEQGFSLCPARCLDVQTIVRCLLLADLAHRQVGCGSSHKD